MSHYKRPASIIGCIALLMSDNRQRVSAFIADFHSNKFPQSLKDEVIETLAQKRRMLQIAELIDQEFDGLVRQTIQPIELFEEMQRNRVQRQNLRMELDRIYRVLGLE